MGVIMFNMYDLNLKLVCVFWMLEIIDFVFCSINKIHTTYLQLEHSAMVTTSNTLISKVIRILFSNLRTPYCTQISMFLCELYLYFSQKKLFTKKFFVDNKGIVCKII